MKQRIIFITRMNGDDLIYQDFTIHDDRDLPAASAYIASIRSKYAKQIEDGSVKIQTILEATS